MRTDEHAALTPDVVYLHGFASSSQSEKAMLTKAFFQTHYPALSLWCPDLPYNADAAWQLLWSTLAPSRAIKPPKLIIGSSLGGFFATALAERLQCNAALINPAVAPHRLLAQHLGRYVHPVLQQEFVVSDGDLPVLAALVPAQLSTPSQFLVLLQQADEVLDYRDALHFYKDCVVDVQTGGNHAYQDYAKRLPDIVKFSQLA
jgi:hypothetical protein